MTKFFFSFAGEKKFDRKISIRDRFRNTKSWNLIFYSSVIKSDINGVNASLACVSALLKKQKSDPGIIKYVTSILSHNFSRYTTGFFLKFLIILFN